MELDALWARYFDLYDLAPVGYCTLSEKGLILESYLAAANLLGVVRCSLVRQPLTRFILSEDQEIYYLHRKLLFETGEPQRCELRMLRLNSPAFWARLEATAALDDDGGTPICRIAISDITDLKQTADLRKVEENFRRSCDDSPLGNRIVTIQGEIIYINRAILDLYGYDSIEEFKSTPVTKRYTIASLAEYQTRRDKRLRGEYVPSGYEISIVRKDGEVRHLKVFRKEVQWDGEILFHEIYEDITDRKRVEEALLREKNIIKAILDSTPGIIYLYNDKAKLVRWNKKHEQMTGYSSEELYGMDVLNWFKGDKKSLSAVTEGLKSTLENGFGEAEADLQRKDGSKIPMYFTACSLTIDSKPYFVGIGIDITDRKRIDEERTLFSSVVEQAEENVLITDNRRTILYINPAFERSSGYCCEELKGQKLKKLRSDQHDEGFYHTTKKILDRGQVW
ncbi:MAG: PAS domain S-box protein, partial [Deltaproteobacteria bacterium]|nr:PAS domain S-box protein [Deltaproteobacteria bacterium]